MAFQGDNDAPREPPSVRTSPKDPGSAVKKDAAVPIHRSSFFVASILESFSRATLNDARFPHRQLDSIMQRAFLPASDREQRQQPQPQQQQQQQQAENGEDDTVAALRTNAGAVHVSDAQRAALIEGIQALGAHVAAVPAPTSRFDTSLDETRLLLGYCYLLAGRYRQASSLLDIVRGSLFARVRGSKRQKQKHDKLQSPGATIDEQSSLQRQANMLIIALWGLELAAWLQGKDDDAVRMGTWRQKAQEERH